MNGKHSSDTRPSLTLSVSSSTGRADEREQRGDEAVEAVLEHLVDRVDVRRLTRDDPARRVAVVERRRQRVEVPEHPAPERQEDVFARPCPTGTGKPDG